MGVAKSYSNFEQTENTAPRKECSRWSNWFSFIPIVVVGVAVSIANCVKNTFFELFSALTRASSLLFALVTYITVFFRYVSFKKFVFDFFALFYSIGVRIWYVGVTCFSSRFLHRSRSPIQNSSSPHCHSTVCRKRQVNSISLVAVAVFLRFVPIFCCCWFVFVFVCFFLRLVCVGSNE